MSKQIYSFFIRLPNGEIHSLHAHDEKNACITAKIKFGLYCPQNLYSIFKKLEGDQNSSPKPE